MFYDCMGNETLCPHGRKWAMGADDGLDLCPYKQFVLSLYPAPMLSLNPGGTSSVALGRRDFVRLEFIAMLNDAGGPCWSYESRAGL